MNRRLLSGIGAAVCAAAIFAGCGGGGGSTSGPIPPTNKATATPTAGSTAVTKIASASFTFVLPFQRIQSTKRGAKFVSPSTQSVKVALLTVNGVAPATLVTNTVNIGATQPSCISNGNGVSCNVSLDAPTGSDTFSVTAYDGLNAGGNIIGSATVPTTILYANAANHVTLSLSGIVASIALFSPLSYCGGECTPTLYAVGMGTPTKALIIPIALDAAGNQILLPGTYDQPITVSIGFAYPTGSVLLTVNGGTAATSVQVNGPSDQVFAVAQSVMDYGYTYVTASFGIPTPAPTGAGTPTPIPSSTPIPMASGYAPQIAFSFRGLATPTPVLTPTPTPTPTPNPISFSVFAATTPSPSPTPFVLPSGATPTPVPPATPIPVVTASPPPGPLPYGGALAMFVGSSTQYLFVYDALYQTGLSYAISGTNCTPGPSSPISSITPSIGIPFASGTALQIQPTTNGANHGTCTLTVTDSTSATNSITINIISITGTVQ